MPLHDTSIFQVLPSVEDNDKNIETALLDHQKQQEKIAQDMIEIAKSLKHQSLAARDIIKSDTKVCNYVPIIILFIVL